MVSGKTSLPEERWVSAMINRHAESETRAGSKHASTQRSRLAHRSIARQQPESSAAARDLRHIRGLSSGLAEMPVQVPALCQSAWVQPQPWLIPASCHVDPRQQQEPFPGSSPASGGHWLRPVLVLPCAWWGGGDWLRPILVLTEPGGHWLRPVLA